MALIKLLGNGRLKACCGLALAWKGLRVVFDGDQGQGGKSGLILERTLGGCVCWLCLFRTHVVVVIISFIITVSVEPGSNSVYDRSYLYGTVPVIGLGIVLRGI